MTQKIIDWIDKFEGECEVGMHTDRCDALDLLHLIRSTLADIKGKELLFLADKDTGVVQDIFLANQDLEVRRKAFEYGLDAVAVTAILTDCRPLVEDTTEEDGT